MGVCHLEFSFKLIQVKNTSDFFSESGRVVFTSRFTDPLTKNISHVSSTKGLDLVGATIVRRPLGRKKKGILGTLKAMASPSKEMEIILN